MLLDCSASHLLHTEIPAQHNHTRYPITILYMAWVSPFVCPRDPFALVDVRGEWGQALRCKSVVSEKLTLTIYDRQVNPYV